jgi:hypothetical protein
MSFKPNKIRVIEFDTDYINSLKLIVDEEDKNKGRIYRLHNQSLSRNNLLHKDNLQTDYFKSTKNSD